jgi:hypothetical protein
MDKDKEASDDGEMGQYEYIKDFSTKVTIVSDGNDTETFTLSVINSENEVIKSSFKVIFVYSVKPAGVPTKSLEALLM